MEIHLRSGRLQHSICKTIQRRTNKECQKSLLIIQSLYNHLTKSQERLFPMFIETQESGQVLDRIVVLF